MKHQKKNRLYPDVYEAWKASPNPANTSAVLKAVDPIITSAVKSYGNGDNRNLTQARILAVKALKTYDPKKNIQLNTYLMSQLKPLTRTARKRQNVIHIPENVYFNQQAIKTARDEHREQHGTDPDHIAIADKTGLTVRQIEKADRYNPAIVSSSMATSDKGDHMSDNKRDYYDIWVDHVYNDMDEKDRKIFSGVSGYKGATIKPKQAIAKELKMSPAAVSYRISNIAKKLEEMPTDADR